MTQLITHILCWEARPKNDRLKRWCVVDAASPGRGKTIIADNIRQESHARRIAASPELLMVAEVVTMAYRDGPVATFHTRINELAGGSFADLLIRTVEKAEVAA